MKVEFFAALLGGAVAAVGATLLLRAWQEPSLLEPATSGASVEHEQVNPQPDAARALLHSLLERVSALESRVAPPAAERTALPPPPQSRPSGAGAPISLWELEQEVRRLREELAQVKQDPIEDTPAGVLQSLDMVGSRKEPLASARARIPLRTRFLELAPNDPRAWDQLQQLVDDYIATGQPKKGFAAIGRLGERLGVESWRLDQLRLGPLQHAGDWLAVIEVGERIARSAVPNETRVAAVEWCAAARENWQRQQQNK